METISKKVNLYWKQLVSPYAIANKEHLVEATRVLGTTLSASNKMISYADENVAFMKEVIGLSPNSPNWDTMLGNYWHSLSVDIPIGGRTLEVGFIYDISIASRKANVEAHNANASKEFQINTNADVVKYFETKLKEITDSCDKALTKASTLGEDKDRERFISNAYKTKYTQIEELERQKYKFGSPIDVADYVLYRYCLIHSEVANEFALVDKSNNIRFYLHSEDEIKQMKKLQLQIERTRMEKVKEVMLDSELTEAILYAAKLPIDVATLDSTDRDLALNDYSNTNPKDFIILASNPNIKTIGLIEKYIAFGILTRIEGSNMIVSSTDASVIVGNSINEAIAFFKNEKENKQVLSEFIARYKGLPKQ